MRAYSKLFLCILCLVPLCTWSQSDLERARGGADSIEGWVIKQGPDGKIIKTPRLQRFQFSGADVEGTIERPPDSVLKPRVRPRRSSLIPERKSFRRETLDVAGFKDRGSL